MIEITVYDTIEEVAVVVEETIDEINVSVTESDEVNIIAEETVDEVNIVVSESVEEVSITASGSSIWGDITGTLSDQSDLQSALDGKASAGHNHNLADLAEKSYDSLDDLPSIPDELSDLADDSTHRTVTDAEKASWDSKGDITLIDTRANILAMSPAAQRLAFATDTREFLLYDGSDWRVAPLELDIISGIDMGAFIPGGLGISDLVGYYVDAITDKTLHNIVLRGNALTENGGLRIDVTQDPDTFEIYLREAWQTILYDLTTDYGDLRHTPLDEQVYVWRGDSVLVGLNGQPTIQEYGASMGAYPPERILSGGTF